MKKINLFLILALLTGTLFSQRLKVSLDYTSYATEKLEPYIEFTFMVDGKSVKYVKNSEGYYEAEIEIKVEVVEIVEEKEGNKVAEHHYLLTSPAYSDTILKNKTPFGDIVNLQVPNGSCFLKFMLKDIHNEDIPPIIYEDNMDIHYPENKVSASTILLASNIAPAKGGEFFEKYGYDFTPLEFNYLPENQNFVFTHFELYNTEKVLGEGASFTVRYTLEGLTNTWMSFSQYNKEFAYKTAPILFVPQHFNFTALPSGNYNLVVEILDAKGNSLVKNVAFLQRYNPKVELDLSNYESVLFDNTFVDKITDIKILKEYVACLSPIADINERGFFSESINKLSLLQLQRFFYSFWINRAPNDPEKAWLAYKAKVDYVQREYGSNVIKGYKTDRGRVYLQYGPPNNIKESVFSPTIHPYQIWQYYDLQGLTNIKFVFCNYDGVTNNYELVHSDKPGEFYNPAWQRDIMKGRESIQNWDIKKPNNFWGNDMDDNWSNF